MSTQMQQQDFKLGYWWAEERRTGVRMLVRVLISGNIDTMGHANERLQDEFNFIEEVDFQPRERKNEEQRTRADFLGGFRMALAWSGAETGSKAGVEEAALALWRQAPAPPG